MFRRPGLPEPAADGPRDPDLPMLSVEQAAALGRLAERAFRDLGVPATYDGHGALATGDVRYGLHNLAASLAEVRWKKWAGLVENHARAMLAVQRTADDEAPVRPEQMLLKLRAFDELPMKPDFDASSGFPGLAALPAVDLPTHVRELVKLEMVDAIGGLDEFRRTALANLRALPPPTHQHLLADDDRPDSSVHAFLTDDFFGASRALVLDSVLAATLRFERPPHGCLVAVPNRHLLAVHVLEGAGVVAALNLLVRMAEGEVDGPGPVTDAVFYVPPDGPAEQVTRREDGSVHVVVDGRFAEAFRALGLLED